MSLVTYVGPYASVTVNYNGIGYLAPRNLSISVPDALEALLLGQPVNWEDGGDGAPGFIPPDDPDWRTISIDLNGAGDVIVRDDESPTGFGLSDSVLTEGVLEGALEPIETQLSALESGSAWDDGADGRVLTFGPGGVIWSAPPSGAPVAIAQGLRAVRDAEYAAVMASPPTIALSAANAATSIASAVEYAHTNGVFRWSGGKVVTLAIYPNYKGIGPVVSDANWLDDAGFQVEFLTDATQFEQVAFGKLGVCRVWVDDRPATAGHTTLGPADGNFYRLLVSSLAAGTKAIRIEYSTANQLGPVRVPTGSVITAVAGSVGPKLIAITDSYGDGPNPDSFNDLFKRAGRLLGIRDTRVSPSGGTGNMNPGPFSRVKFRSRVQEVMLNYTPDIALVAGGINDSDRHTSAIYPAGAATALTVLGTEAAALYDAIRSGSPTSALVVVGPWWPNENPTNNAAGSDVIGVRDTIEAKALAAGAIFIDPIGEQWITGTGRVGTPAGNGNADYYISSDGTHPSPAGHAYLGRKLEQALAPYVPLSG